MPLIRWRIKPALAQAGESIHGYSTLRNRLDRRRRRRPQCLAGAAVFAAKALHVALAARNADKLATLAARPAQAFACDATDAQCGSDAVRRRRSATSARPTSWSITPAARARGPFVELAPPMWQTAIAVSAFGGFLVAQQAAKRMLPHRRGAILFTGASASVKGYRAVGAVRHGQIRVAWPGAKHGARVLAARHSCRAFRHRWRHPQRRAAPNPPTSRTRCSIPDAIAARLLDVLQQPRSAWSWEIELRPWVEKF